MAVILVLATVSGLLIGCVGIGGVLLVPCLTALGTDVHAAIAVSMFSFIFSGMIGVALYAREGTIEWRAAGWLGAGGMPGAYAGALLASRAEGRTLLLLVGVAVLFAGIRSLLPRSPAAPADAAIPRPLTLVFIGVLVGVLSSLTGSGGPLVLVPLLMWIGTPVLFAVGLGQAIQIPISLLATLGNFGADLIDMRLAVLVSAGVTVGTAVGARAAHALPKVALTRIVAVVLLLVGGLVIVRATGGISVLQAAVGTS